MIPAKGDATRLIVNLAYIVAVAAIAMGLAWPIYSTPRVALVSAVGVALGISIALIGRRLRWPVLAIVAAALLAYVVVVVPVAIPSALTSPLRVLRGIGDGVVGIVVGWKQLLTLTLPVGDYQAVLVPLLVVMLFGTLLATVAVTGTGRFAATAVPIAALMAAFGLVFGSSNTGEPLAVGPIVLPAPREVILTTALILVSLAWLVGSARLTRARALRVAQAHADGVRQGGESVWFTVRRQALAIVLVAAALVGGIAVAPIAAGWTPRQALRDSVDPEVVVQQQTSPLSRYRASFDADAFDAELFRVEGDTSGISRVRIATLGQYDGQVFRSGTRTGDQLYTRLPRSAQAAGSVSLTVTIGAGFDGVWVPIPGYLEGAPTFLGARAEQLTDHFYVASSDGSAVDVVDTTGGGFGLVSGDRYTVQVLPDSSTSTLGDVRGGGSLVASDDYAALVAWVKAQKQPRTGEGLTELLTRLRERGYLSHSLVESDASAPWIGALEAQGAYAFQPSYSGHSAARIETLFSTLNAQQRLAGADATDALLVSAIGDDEQFAAAAALIARFYGFESRVVLGARLSHDDRQPSVAACVDGVCTGANLAAWVEVQSPQGGWVVFDTSPQFEISPTDVAEGEELPENPTLPQTAESDVLDPPAAQRDDAEATNSGADDTPAWLTTLLAVVAVIATVALGLFLLVLPLAFLLVVKRVRRRGRRLVPVPEVAIVGAWDELLDSYVDYGVDIPRSATRSAIALEIGRPAVIRLAAIVDGAVFAEHPPRAEARDTAWSIVDTERRELAQMTRFKDRIRARISLASFLRHTNPRAALVAGLSGLRKEEIAQ
ncbi:MAG: transglutaminase domain-containing protein [Microbacteriaceae bacterium]